MNKFSIRLLAAILISGLIAACSPDETNPPPTKHPSSNEQTAPIGTIAKPSVTVEKPSLLKTMVMYQREALWLLSPVNCPTQFMNKPMKTVGFEPEYCLHKQAKCLQQCKAGDPSACYNLAFDLQRTQGDTLQRYVSALFVWACKAGAVSGCTNYAISLAQQKTLPNSCAIKTYKKACQYNDPWGCTLFGESLATGFGVKRNKKEALHHLTKACRFGSDDPACQRANTLLKMFSLVVNSE